MRLRHLAALTVLLSALLSHAAETAPVNPPAPDLLALASALPLRPVPHHSAMAVEPVLSSTVVPVPEPRAHRVFDKKFAFLAVVSTALTVADYEMTASCLARHACAEADPFLPHTRAGMYSTNIPLNAVLFYWSYRRKATGKKLWWMPPAAIIGSHLAGAASNLRFR